jgi:hypothetical protein
MIRVSRYGREKPMTIVRLQRHQYPSPPHFDIRQHAVLDSRGRDFGQVVNLYVEEDSRALRFVHLVTRGFLGLGKTHHLVPAEAINEERPGWIRLRVDQQIVESAPMFPNPHVGPDSEYQRTIREHYGYASPG